MLSAMKLLWTVISMAVAVTAHGHVTNIVVNGVYYRNFLPNIDPYNPNPPKVMGWTAGNTDNGYVAPSAFQSPDIICHVSATPGKAHVAVQAGDSISIQWNTWPESHHGPVIDYLARCNGTCETVDKTALKFFKIDGVGLVSGYNPGYWADDILISNGASWLVKIPEDIAPGNYVLRHEIIALHGAHESNAAQAYPQCFNLEISGKGTSEPSGVYGTDLYRASDEGIRFNIYTSFTYYPLPGPTLISGAVVSLPQFKSSVTVTSTATAPVQISVVPTSSRTSTSSQTTSSTATSVGNTFSSSTSSTQSVSTTSVGTTLPSSTSSTQSVSTTSNSNSSPSSTGSTRPGSTTMATVTTATAPATTRPPAALGQTQWGQCGGSYYAGPTSCYGSNSCSTLNPWYAQCVPRSAGENDGQTIWGQCGGENWSGKTSCQPPATCSVFNQWYAQCLY